MQHRQLGLSFFLLLCVSTRTLPTKAADAKLRLTGYVRVFNNSLR